MKRLLCLLLALALCGGLIWALAEEEEQEVSLADQLNNASATPTPVPPVVVPTPDPAEPVYELDGSILVKLSFTGDVTIGGDVRKSTSIFDEELKKHGGDITFPFKNVQAILADDDMTLINFETTLTDAPINSARKNNQFLFSAPAEYVQMLTYGSVEAVSFENNHADDHGEQGRADTKQALTDAGIGYASDSEPCIKMVKGVKIGMLAYCTVSDADEYPRIYEQMPREIASLREQGCEIVIVSYHWGFEKDYAPTNNQQKLGHATIDAGADLVIGHHSHRINPIEEYKGKYICYSLGNFSFAGNSNPDDMSTFIFQTRFRVKDGVAKPEGFLIIPCRISSFKDYNDFVPTPYDKEQSIESVLTVLRKNGADLAYAVEQYPLKWPEEE